MGRQSTRLVADAIYTAWLLSKARNGSSDAAETLATPTAVAPVGEWDERVARAAEFDRRADMLKTDELLADDASGADRNMVYVGPAGDDQAGSGSRASPFASIERALDAVDAAASASIMLLNGSYNIDRTVVVADRKNLRIAAVDPGGAVISGGIRAKGWKKSPNAMTWEAPLGAALRSFGTYPRFRQLFVNGRRANRTRHTLAKGAVLRTATAADLNGTKGFAAGDAAAFRLGYVTDDATARSWPDGAVEMVWTGRLATHSDDPHHNWPWNEPRCPVD
eukprot:COSAG04_NODE_4647_length_1972_cov_1.580886_2_plen_278_part_01